MMDDESQQEPQHISSESCDWFLRLLVKLADNRGVEIGITLQVSGFLVSGQLVGEKKYFDGFASDFSSAFHDQESAEIIQRAFSSLGEDYAVESKENADRPPPAYIHLTEARFFNSSGNPIPVNRGVWWRGRLSDVSGFILGSLG